MAKKALVQKQQRKPKFKVRAYTRCRRCGRPRSVYRKFGLCRICLRELSHAGDLACVCHLPETDTTQAEVAVHRTRPAAAAAARIRTHLELRLAL